MKTGKIKKPLMGAKENFKAGCLIAAKIIPGFDFSQNLR